MIHPVIEGEFLVAHLTADTIMGHVAKDIFEAMGARANLSQRQHCRAIAKAK